MSDERDELPELRGLRMAAPVTVFDRFRRRAGLMQGGRLLLDAQVNGFWVVLDTLLKIFFKTVPVDGGTTKAKQMKTGDKG